MSPRAKHLAAAAALAVALVAAWWRTLHDAAFWDGMFYAQQIHDIVVRGLDAHAYRTVPFLRPPLYTGTTALLMRLFGEHIAVAHVASWLWALAALPAIWRLARRLGAGAAGAWLAVGLFAVSPPFLAQGGQLLTDLPVTALTTLAWSFAVEGALGGFVAVACAAVLCKEVAWFVCVPAFVWFAWRRRGEGWLRAGLWALPTLLPGVVLAGWLVAQHALTGTWLYEGSRNAIGLHWLPSALNRTFVDQGRILLWLAAPFALRGGEGELRARRWATLAVAAWLPLAFPAPLPRYMLPSLPLVTAVAAVAIAGFAPLRRWAATAVVVALSIAMWFGPVKGHAAPDFDANLVHRKLLDAQRQAVRALLAAPSPRPLLAGFPMVLALRQPPVGEVDQPVAVDIPQPGATLEWLCAHDRLVEGALGAPVVEARERLRAAGALGPPARYGQPGLDVTVYPIACH